jgi:hypothetical protein
MTRAASSVSSSVLSWGAFTLASCLALGCGGSSQTPYSGGGAGQSGTAGSDGAGGSGQVTDMGVVTVDATKNFVTLGGCGFQPAAVDVGAGTFTVSLSASTLSKGGVSGTTPPTPSVDNYVIIHAPLGAGDAHEDHRFFMLNGIGASVMVTLGAPGSLQAMFIDSDTASNNGMGTVTITPGGATATVSASTNVLAYDALCHSNPAMTRVGASGMYRLTLLDSTLSSGAGAHDDFVLVRTPSEQPMQDDRYVILNGVGATHDFAPFNSQTVKMWYIGASAGTGVAHVRVGTL